VQSILIQVMAQHSVVVMIFIYVIIQDRLLVAM